MATAETAADGVAARDRSGRQRARWRGHRRVVAAIVAPLISAAALYFAGPGTGGTGWLAWFALVPFLMAIEGCPAPAALGRGLLWGVAYNLLTLTWARPFGPPAWLGLTAVQSVEPALFAVVAAPMLRHQRWPAIWGVAALWALSEAVRQFISFGLSWGDLSLTQVGFAPALHTASWWGSIGLSFLVALANAAIYGCIRGCRPVVALVFLAASLIGGAFGARREARRIDALPSDRRVTVGLAQADMGRALFTGAYAEPWRALESYEELTRELARRGCRWVIWPESALPEDERDRFDRVSALARKEGIYILSGAFDYRPEGAYNSVFCFAPDGRIVDVYHKRRLVPFGEFVPWRRFLPSLAAFGVPDTDLAMGEGDGIVRAGELRIGVGICFESLFPGLAIQAARSGADILAVATNDSYYGRSPAAAYHAASLRLRSAETGLPGVQAAATGISLAALPDGRIAARSGLFQRDALVVSLPRIDRSTFWVSAPWLPWMALVGLATAGAWTVFSRRRLTS